MRYSLPHALIVPRTPVVEILLHAALDGKELDACLRLLPHPVDARQHLLQGVNALDRVHDVHVTGASQVEALGLVFQLQ